MFIHNFKYAFKILFRNKMLIFWTFAFPIILGTFFNMAFSNIEKSEKLDIINMAIVENEGFKESEMFKETFEVLSDEKNKDRLFCMKYVSEEEAKELLKEGEITGYLLLEKDEPKVVVQSSGINETILKSVTEEITQTSKIVENLVGIEIENKPLEERFSINYTEISKKIVENIKNKEAKIKDTSSNHLSYTMIEFYTLIAMTCLYGGTLSMAAINQNLANMSSNGKRVSVAPTSKAKIILSSLLASFVTQLIGLAILFIYTIFALKVDYGTNLPFIILLGIMGSVAGLAMGLAIATIIKGNENLKTGILISVTMLGCFLSGMMGITMKYIVDKNIPIINRINPASMITDGFYALYYYDTLDRYFFNMISLAVFATIAIGVSYIQLRRQKYDSI